MKDERFRDWRVQSALIHSHGNKRFVCQRVPRESRHAELERADRVGDPEWLFALLALALLLTTTGYLLWDKYGRLLS